MSFFNSIKAIFLKDLRMELRSRQFLGNTFMFALLVIVVFNFAFRLTPANTKELASGILWVAFLFAGTLGLGRSFQVEAENDAMHGITLSPVDRTAFFIAKVLVNLFFLVMVQAALLPLFIILYNLNVLEHFCQMLLLIFLADIGFMTLGTLLSAIAVNLKARELMLPILLLPLLIPLIIFAASGTSALIETGNMEIYYSRLKLIGAFDAIFFVVSSLLFEHIVDE